MTNEQAWNFAIGIVQIDGIKPSEEFLELVERQNVVKSPMKIFAQSFFASMLSANNFLVQCIVLPMQYAYFLI